jgi:hypothetical protein
MSLSKKIGISNCCLQLAKRAVPLCPTKNVKKKIRNIHIMETKGRNSASPRRGQQSKTVKS